MVNLEGDRYLVSLPSDGSPSQRSSMKLVTFSHSGPSKFRQSLFSVLNFSVYQPSGTSAPTNRPLRITVFRSLA